MSQETASANRGRQIALFLGGGWIVGANLGTLLCFLVRWLLFVPCYLIEAAGVAYGVYKLAKPPATASPEEAVQKRVVLAMLVTPVVTLATAPLWLAWTFKNTDLPRFVYLTNGGLAGLVGGLFALAWFLQVDMRRESTIKSARSKVADSHRAAKDQNMKDAEDRLREGLLEVELLFGSIHPETAFLVQELGRFFVLNNEHEKAGAMFKWALSIYEQTKGQPDDRVAECLQAMGEMEAKADPDSALLLLRRALHLRESKLGADSAEVGRTLFALCNVLIHKEKWAEAEDVCKKSQAIIERQLGAAHPESMAASGRLASVYVKLSKFLEAEKVLQGVMTEREKAGAGEDDELVGLLVEMGRVQNAQERPKDALKTFVRALNVVRRATGPDHKLLKEILEQCKPKMIDVDNPPPDYEAALTSLLDGDLKLLRKAFDADPALINTADGTGWAPLQWAIFLGLDRVIEALLFAGAELEPDTPGMPPFLIAARWGNRKALQTLINKGVDINMQDTNGWTALHCVAAGGDERTIESLKNADVTKVDRDGYTPLHVACAFNSHRVVVELLSKGADKDAQAPPSMYTPLHVAAQKGNKTVVEILFLNGANPALKDNQGRSAYDLAVGAGMAEVAKMMKA